MEYYEIAYSLQDIVDQLRVHMLASPLDDIVENSIEELEDMLKQINQEI